MTNRITLLAAAALVLPAGMAIAQSAAPGGNGPRPGTGAATSAAARHNANPAAAGPATEDAQGNAQAAESAPPAQSDANTQASTASPPADPAPAQATAASAPAATPPRAAPAVRAATAADLHAGAQVVDTGGAVVGTVESADATGAIVSTGAVRARVPLASFASNGIGLVISMNRTQFEAAARSAAAAHPTAG